jgi:hypothetical protein
MAAKVITEVEGVVGIPRSGMIPASQIATVFHLPLGMAGVSGIEWSNAPGRPGRIVEKPNGKVLVVDDTSYSGRSLAYAKRRFDELGISAIYAAVFVRNEKAANRAADLWGEVVGDRHVNEWNLLNNGILRGWDGGIGLDLDGIICHDPPMNDLTEPEAYEMWLSAAVPYLLPRSVVCPLILTGRLEKYRQLTEAWLGNYGVRYDQLVMYPADSPQQRTDICQWKADQLKASGVGAYIESHPPHARAIAHLSGLPVGCPASEAFYQRSHTYVYGRANL